MVPPTPSPHHLLFHSLKSACPGVREQEPLAKRTTLQIGGPADFFADVQTVSELTALRHVVEASLLPVFFLGAGSNLLISDKGIRGLVLHLGGDFKRVDFQESTLSAGAGALMPTLARQAAQRGLSGVESLIGVPGTVGGGLVMNAGTREGWIGDVTTEIEALAAGGKIHTISREDWGFSYRHSKLEGLWITGATLTLKKEDPIAVQKKVDDLLAYRTKTQPLTTSNCGSVFKNPPEGAAAKFVEECGMKGQAVGRARVSNRHANFILNEGGATAAEVRSLIDTIQMKVQKQFNVCLEPEVKFAGEW